MAHRKGYSNVRSYIGKTFWLIEGPDGYRSRCYETRTEARFRLREMAQEPFYLDGDRPVRQADDFYVLANGETYQVVKL